MCLKYFIILKWAKIKRLCGRPRLPVWIWALDTNSDQREMLSELFKRRILLSWILLAGLVHK